MKLNIFAVFLLIALNQELSEAQVCFNGWTEADNNCYKLFDPDVTLKRLDWFESEKYCQALGGNLASFSSLDTLTIVSTAAQLTTKLGYFWIGFNIVDKTSYQWSDGSPVTFTNWLGGQPDNFNNNEQCAEIRNNGRWNDGSCYGNHGWICKIAKGVVPTFNTIVVQPTFPVSECAEKGNSNLDWVQFDEKCYYSSPDIESQWLTWQTAEAFCKRNGGFLLSIHSRRELNFVNSKMAKPYNNTFWIGLNELSTSTGYVWSDNTPVNFVNWRGSQPSSVNENCVEMLRYNSFWNDINCGTKNPYVCEKLKSGAAETDQYVQPLNFGDGKPCPDGYSTFGVTSTGGSGDSSPCVFPFRYNQKLYYECISLDKNTPWCATTSDYDRDNKWGNCVSVKCYKLVTTEATYNEAKATCLAEESKLASITSAYEQALVTTLLKSRAFDNFYIGGYFSGYGSFLWEDNTDFGFTNWAFQKPSDFINTMDRCITVSSDPRSPGLWSNVNCNQRAPFICAKPSFGVKYAAVCENWPDYITPLQLRCETNTKIVIVKADFGRDRYSIACDNKYYDGNCTSRVSTEAILRNLCGGKQNCTVSPTGSIHNIA